MYNMSHILLIIFICFLYFIFKNKTKSSNKHFKSKILNLNENTYPYFTYSVSNKVFIRNSIVWGFACGYKWEKINMFVISLRNSGYKGDLVLAISHNYYLLLKHNLQQYNIKAILIENEWPFYSVVNHIFPINNTFLKECSLEMRNYGRFKWNVYRYSVLHCWLLVYGKNYSHFFSLDVRDVVFQGNPFQWNFNDGLYVVDETRCDNILIKDNNCNLNWIKVYKNYTNIINNKIINSGTIFGTKNYFIPFISQFYKFIKDNYILTNEQGTLNYAYYTGYFKKIKFYMNKNQKGVVLTTGLDLYKILKFRKNNKIYNEDGTLPLIVHQYDRSSNLSNMYRIQG